MCDGSGGVERWNCEDEEGVGVGVGVGDDDDDEEEGEKGIVGMLIDVKELGQKEVTD